MQLLWGQQPYGPTKDGCSLWVRDGEFKLLIYKDLVSIRLF